MISRRGFLSTIVGSGAVIKSGVSALKRESIDREALNPHRLHLGQIGLRRSDGEEIRSTDLSDINQELDLWLGRLTSRFTLYGKPVTVTTAVHPDRDLLAVRIDSVLWGDEVFIPIDLAMKLC